MSESTSIDSQQQEPGSVQLVLALALAGFLSGLAIIGIYESTFETIKANQAHDLEEAVLRVLPGVTQMHAWQPGDSPRTLIPATGAAGEDPVYAGYTATGQFVGYALSGEGPGFQDNIRLLYGYLPDAGHIVGLEILDSRETPGLGDKIYKDADFVANFRNLAAEPAVKAVKKGKKAAPHEIDAITGATISSKAVVKIINQTHQHWRERWPEAPPPLP